MSNHIHLIAVPERADSLARALGRAHNFYSRGDILNFAHSLIFAQGRMIPWSAHAAMQAAVPIKDSEREITCAPAGNTSPIRQHLGVPRASSVSSWNSLLPS